MKPVLHGTFGSGACGVPCMGIEWDELFYVRRLCGDATNLVNTNVVLVTKRCNSVKPFLLILGYSLRMGIKTLIIILLTAVATTSIGQNATKKPMTTNSNGLRKATFGGGCFWCTEAVFLDVKGVQSVESGYTGGTTKNPTYKEVSSGLTGHAEVIQITYDPTIVSFDVLVEIFWNTHDPTTLNKQGADEGTQYRSVIFYHDETQKKVATEYKAQLEASHAYPSRIVTEISPLTAYYKAEDYHQNYYALNQNQGYCQYVIRPKVDKFRKQFRDKLK